MIRLRRDNDGINRSIQFAYSAGEVWLYTGRSFGLDRRIQRHRLSRDCGYVQFAYGRVRHYGRMARKTVGLQFVGAER